MPEKTVLSVFDRKRAEAFEINLKSSTLVSGKAISAQTLSGTRGLSARLGAARERRSSCPTARSPQSSAIYLTQPRGPSAALGFDRRHLTAAQARRHEQFKRLSFLHGLGGEGRARSRRLVTDAPRRPSGSPSAGRRRRGRKGGRRRRALKAGWEAAGAARAGLRGAGRERR